ncbi:ComF family protein [Alicyclobacillus acidocaldarius]|uniref:ComF family protein n=1 Tax=Alicyclobacillus acidocaldarius TaxID=405212 RepID=UPI00130543A3|nr:phosphoribosyltransferase family protein [Alicyclobacillus acidocaldarius]
MFIYSDWNQIGELQGRVHPSAEFVEGPRHVLFGINKLITSALNAIDGQKYETAYATSNLYEIQALMSEHIGTIFVGDLDSVVRGHMPDLLGYMPDFLAHDGADVLKIVRNEWKGYLSEVLTTKIDRSNWYGNGGLLFSFNREYDGYTFRVFCGGRYFGPRHERWSVHQLSHRIWKSKRDTSQNELFAEVFSVLVNDVENRFEVIDGITRVPPRPNEQDRFKPIVELLCSRLDKLDLSTALVCTQKYPKQKGLDKEARRANVKDKFRATEEVRGKHVVLLDDVYVTGSTALECAKTIMEKGARKVTVVVLALNQFPPEWRKFVTLPCPNCNGQLTLRIASNQGAFLDVTSGRTQNAMVKWDFGWMA